MSDCPKIYLKVHWSLIVHQNWYKMNTINSRTMWKYTLTCHSFCNAISKSLKKQIICLKTEKSYYINAANTITQNAIMHWKWTAHLLAIKTTKQCHSMLITENSAMHNSTHHIHVEALQTSAHTHAHTCTRKSCTQWRLWNNYIYWINCSCQNKTKAAETALEYIL